MRENEPIRIQVRQVQESYEHLPDDGDEQLIVGVYIQVSMPLSIDDSTADLIFDSIAVSMDPNVEIIETDVSESLRLAGINAILTVAS